MDQLPNDVLLCIFDHTDAFDLPALSSTCKKIRDLTRKLIAVHLERRRQYHKLAIGSVRSCPHPVYALQYIQEHPEARPYIEHIYYSSPDEDDFSRDSNDGFVPDVIEAKTTQLDLEALTLHLDQPLRDECMFAVSQGRSDPTLLLLISLLPRIARVQSGRQVGQFSCDGWTGHAFPASFQTIEFFHNDTEMHDHIESIMPWAELSSINTIRCSKIEGEAVDEEAQFRPSGLKVLELSEAAFSPGNLKPVIACCSGLRRFAMSDSWEFYPDDEWKVSDLVDILAQHAPELEEMVLDMSGESTVVPGSLKSLEKLQMFEGNEAILEHKYKDEEMHIDLGEVLPDSIETIILRFHLPTNLAITGIEKLPNLKRLAVQNIVLLGTAASTLEEAGVTIERLDVAATFSHTTVWHTDCPLSTWDGTAPEDELKRYENVLRETYARSVG